MTITEKQIKDFASSILLSDIKNYINSHQEEYKKFIENEEEKHNCT